MKIGWVTFGAAVLFGISSVAYIHWDERNASLQRKKNVYKYLQEKEQSGQRSDSDQQT